MSDIFSDSREREDDPYYGLMERQPHDYGHGGSRDYCLPTIPCDVTICPVNKNNKCSMASVITINAAGKCQTGIDFLKDIAKKSKAVIDGD